MLNDILNLKNYCEKIREKTFKKNEIITSYIEKRKQIFILIEGEACLIRYDEHGNKDIIDFFKQGDVFGEAFYIVKLSSEFSVVATKNSKVLTFMYDDISRKCNARCKYHEELSSHLLEILFTTTQHLNSRIEIITKRTIRDKVLFYLESLSIESFTNVVKLPYSLTDLADYLSINRSAMMRELKELEDCNFIKKISRNTYKLLYK